MNKIFLKDYLISNDPDLLFVTETWLKPDILSSIFCPHGYSVIRDDRLASKNGGGVLVIYKSHLPVEEVTFTCENSTFLHTQVDFLCIDLFDKNNTARFLCFYIPPDCSCQADIISKTCDVISSVIPFTTPIYIFGDFNLPCIDWEIPISKGGPSHDHFVDFCIENSLAQCIMEPTHDKGNTLDLLLCNHLAYAKLMNCSVNPPLTKTCDHNTISFEVKIKQTLRNSPKSSYPNFKLADFDSINNKLQQINWNNILDVNTELQQNYNKFISVIQNLILKHVPLKYSNVNKRNKKPNHLKLLLKEKLKIYKEFKTNKSLRDKYKQSCKNYEDAMKKWQNKLEQQICKNPSSRKFYSYINKKLKSQNCIPNLIDKNNQTVENDTEKANLFNLYFQKVFTQDNGKKLRIKSKKSNKMPPFEISVTDITYALLNSKDKISRTPDNVPAHFIKRIGPYILEPLHFIFNQSLKLNAIPTQWKSALIVPIFKRGNRNTVDNYRPVSLTSSFSRLLESILVAKIMQHLLTNDLLTSRQFGFIPGKSTSSQLLTASFEWLYSLSRNLETNIIYTDVSKAFDTVSHQKLITTLKAFKIDPFVVEWIENFLTGRTQQVVINECLSAPAEIYSGVPQGSVLGPCIFNIFYNDIVEDCVGPIQDTGNISLFADDMKLFSTETPNLQSSLNLVNEWTISRQLNLAPAKCVSLKISKRGIDSNDTSFSINQQQIQSVKKFKDLGVFISEDLKWSKHINYITRNASNSLYHIMKVFNSKNIWILLKLYNTYVRPKLECNTSVWSPYLKQDINKIEKVQQKFTKFAMQKCNIPFTNYNDRLTKLNIKSLYHRRIIFDLIQFYKIINGVSDINFNDYFTFKSHQYNLRRNSRQVQSNFNFKNQKFDQCFFLRIVKYWNALPEDVVVAPSIEVFRRRVHSIDVESLLQ